MENSLSRHAKGCYPRNIELIGVRRGRNTGELLGVFDSYEQLRDILSESPPKDWWFGFCRYHVAGPRIARPVGVRETLRTRWYMSGSCDFEQWARRWVEEYDLRLSVRDG